MRKITEQAVNAFMNAQEFKSSNTRIEVLTNVTIMYLHENAIAYRYNDPEKTISITNAGWKTNTTKERLNDIPNVNIYQKKGVWYLNEKEWDGSVIDILI